MSRLLAFIVGVLVFLGWVRLVGNPHVVETVIGLVLSIAIGWWVYAKLKKIFPGKGQPKGDPSK